MQVDDCDLSPLADRPIPESGHFVNSERRRPPLSERVYRFLERVRLVVPVTREPARRGGKSVPTP